MLTEVTYLRKGKLILLDMVQMMRATRPRCTIFRPLLTHAKLTTATKLDACHMQT